MRRTLSALLALLLPASLAGRGQRLDAAARVRVSAQAPQLTIIDTDIGDDIDDVLALGLALGSPELHLLGITTAWGDTELRARLVDRLPEQTGLTGIPVATGIAKHGPGEAQFSQRRWAERGPSRPHPDAVNFLLDEIRRYPHQITLIAIAPLTNVAAAFERSPETFRQLRRIVMMGGAVDRGYGDLGYRPPHGSGAEYNLAMDSKAAQSVFGSGVPIFLMPLDSTQLKLDEVKREFLFTQSNSLTDALTLLYQQWSRQTKQETPTVFDAMAVAYAIQLESCPVTPLHLGVRDDGMTIRDAAGPVVQVCLRSDSDPFFQFFLPRLLEFPPGTPVGADSRR